MTAARWVAAVRSGSGALGAAVLLVLLAAAAVPRLFTAGDPYAINADVRMRGPSIAHPFGTDDLGRDVYTRTIYGARVTLGSAALVVTLSAVAGTLIGLAAGYFGRSFGEAVMRVADVFIAFPSLIMAMGIVALLGPGLGHAMLAVMVIWWAEYARLARGQVLVEKAKPYVEAARSIGRSDWGILRRHILPNAWVPLLVKGTLDLGGAVLLTASLSFMGLGAQPPSAELGVLVTDGRRYLLSAWWYSTFPGLMMFLMVFGCNLFGDSLRDAMDPTLRGGG
jgi:peptide/nickel transport system permease protein